MNGNQAYGASKKYVDETLKGAGALKGKDGTSIVNAVDNGDGSFYLTKSDGTKTNKVKTIPGEEGKSAYEVAQEQGFPGTEEEWLESLKGEKGDKGDPGVGADIAIEEIKDVFVTSPQENDLLGYSETAKGWVNKNMPFIPQTVGDLTDGGDYAKTADVVEKESGKSLVSDTDIAQITANKDAIDILNGDASTSGSVDKKLADAIVTEFGETPSDEKVPSEKLVKDTLDTKADSAIVTGYTNLARGTDFNTLITYGTHRTMSTRLDSFVNIPVRKDGILEVRPTGTIMYQTYKTVDCEEYIRYSQDSGATWGEWTKFALDYNLADYVAIQQKAEDKGKALIVGEDGKVILGTVATDGLEIIDKTQAEYDALTDAEKNDPTKLYNITDAEDIDISNYATLEYVDEELGKKADETSLNAIPKIKAKTYNCTFTNGSCNVELKNELDANIQQFIGVIGWGSSIPVVATVTTLTNYAVRLTCINNTFSGQYTILFIYF